MRVKGGFVTRRRHKKLLKMARGYRGARSKVYRVAKNAVIKALSNSYAHRKKKKRDFRRLWIMRINAAVREHGLSYSKFMHGLKESNIGLNRKVLADMAIKDKAGFQKLVEMAKTKV